MTLECKDCGGLIDQAGESLEPDTGRMTAIVTCRASSPKHPGQRKGRTPSLMSLTL